MTKTPRKEVLPKSVPIHEFLDMEIARAGLTKQDFADEAGVSRSGLYNALRGDPISRKMAKRIAGILGHSHDFWMRSDVLVGEGANIVQFSEVSTVTAAMPGEGNAPQLLTDEMVKGAIANQLISISNYVPSNQKSATYDLTLGDFVLPLTNKRRNLEDLKRGDFSLDHLQCVSASTREAIGLPKHFFARVGATADLAKKGIIVNCGLQVDPGFSGPLDISILNASGMPFSLFAGQVIISIELYYIPIAPMHQYQGDDADVSHIFELKRAVLSKLSVRPASDDRFVVSWDAAGFEVIVDGPEDIVLDLAANLLAAKLENPGTPADLEAQLNKIASEVTPTVKEFDDYLTLCEKRETLPLPKSVEKLQRPSFLEGEETLRSIMRQCKPTLNELFSSVLRLQQD